MSKRFWEIHAWIDFWALLTIFHTRFDNTFFLKLYTFFMVARHANCYWEKNIHCLYFTWYLHISLKVFCFFDSFSFRSRSFKDALCVFLLNSWFRIALWFMLLPHLLISKNFFKIGHANRYWGKFFGDESNAWVWSFSLNYVLGCQ